MEDGFPVSGRPRGLETFGSGNSIASSWLVAGLFGLGFHMSSEVDWRMDFRFPVGHVVLEVVGVVAGGWLAGRAGTSAGCAMM